MSDFLPPHGGDTRRLLKEAGLCGQLPGNLNDALVGALNGSLEGALDAPLLDLSVNVRACGPPEYLRLAMTRALADLGRYPSPQGEEVKEAAARYHGVAPDQIVVGNGTNEIFHAAARWLARSGLKTALVVEPAFSTYHRACERAGLDVRQVMEPLGSPASGIASTRRLPLKALLEQKGPACVFLANPENPSGAFHEPGQLLNLMKERPDWIFVLDEAFLLYAGSDAECSLIPHLEGLENALVVRSLTKFHGLAGIRAGYAVLGKPAACDIEAELGEWRSNALALSACMAIFEGGREAREDEEATRGRNEKVREHLAHALQGLPLDVFPSRANYLLVRLEKPCPGLAQELLRDSRIALRDCRNFHGLEDGRHFRIAVHGEEANERLVSALAKALLPKGAPAPALLRSSRRPRKTPALMIQGTCSGAGKSVLAAAFCRIFREDGWDVAPFKAQNMALNSGVTRDGLEMGRAQMTQALACGLEPDVRMNPVLLKPMSEKGSQVVLLGKPHKILSARDFATGREALRGPIEEAYESLASEHELMVLEGAGSPAEVNLKAHDLVNMSMARFADARVLLCGDIDRGGVYASFLGTWLTFDTAERRLLAGYLVNRFRGDQSLLAPAHDYLKKATGKDVLGVVPYLRDLDLPEEDSVTLAQSLTKEPEVKNFLDIAVVALGSTSNFTDMAPLKAEKDVRLRVVENVDQFGEPHIVILPGSRNVMADLDDLDRRDLAFSIWEHACIDERWLVGICGGLQMIGYGISDPFKVESGRHFSGAMGILSYVTTLDKGKTLTRRENVPTPFGVPCSGYEIHHGVTHFLKGDFDDYTMMHADDGSFLGALNERVFVTYLHGIFDDDLFRRTFLNHVRKSFGMKPIKTPGTYSVDKGLDRLAEEVRASVDMDAVYRKLGLK